MLQPRRVGMGPWGMDVGSPIDFTYTLPFAFTGKIDHFTIELKPEHAQAAHAA